MTSGESGTERESVPVYTNLLPMPVTDEMLRDMGLLPSEPLPPLSRRERLIRTIRSAYWNARWRAAEAIAGQPIGQEDDW